MPKCPYCSQEIHLQDFFENSKVKTKNSKIKVKVDVLSFNGEIAYVFGGAIYARMWACPFCDTILGFTGS